MSQVVLAMVLALSLVASPRTGSHSSVADAAPPSVAPVALPLTFEANRGQADASIRYIARAPQYTMGITRVGVLLSARIPAPGASALRRAAIWLKPQGMDAAVRVAPQNRLPGTVNYFIGNDPSRWRAGIPTFGAVLYRNVYPGIDLRFYSRGKDLEYDWVVAPGARVDRIRLRVSGATAHLDGNGDLLLGSGGVQIRQRHPVTYSLRGGQHIPVAAHYRLLSRHTVGFTLGNYSHNAPLVIDPTLVYSTYLGGRDADGGYGIAVDKAGNAYVTGDTQSVDLPLMGGTGAGLKSSRACANSASRVSQCPEAFVSKISPDGTHLLYSTYLGGTNDDYGHGIGVDSSGNAYITGNTLSPDFPVAHALQSRFGGGRDLGDAYLTKLNSQGKIIFSTYVGGSGDDDGEGLDLSGGSVYVTGSTTSGNFPVSHAWKTHAGGRDAFVFKMPKNGSTLTYSTYLGGSRSDAGTGIAVWHGNAYISGTTTSADFSTVRPLQKFGGGSCGTNDQPTPCGDAFLTTLKPGGTPAYSTYLGGNGDDGSDDVAVDRAGNAYIAGTTESRNFPLVHALQDRLDREDSDGFVTKVNAAGNTLAFSTYLGGSDGDEVYGVTVDAAGYVFTTGSTISSDFPTKDAIQARLPSSADTQLGLNNTQNAFVSVFKPGGRTLLYSTYLGGTDHDLGGHIVADNRGNAYITGFATSTDFPVSKGALQRKHRGGTFDAFVAKIYHPLPAPSAAAASAKKKCSKGYKLVRGTCTRTGG